MKNPKMVIMITMNYIVESIIMMYCIMCACMPLGEMMGGIVSIVLMDLYISVKIHPFFDHIVCRNSIDHKGVVNKIYSALAFEYCQISPPELMTYHVHPTK